MYRSPKKQLSLLDDFYLPFGGKLRADNRWVQLAKIIPWDIIEQKYATLFADGKGAPAKPVRMALGALIIKEKCGYSDRETVEQITENPYLQYFIGLKEFRDEAPFDPSLMVHFRKRFGFETMQEINEMICQVSAESPNSDAHKNDDDQNNDTGHGNGPESPTKFQKAKSQNEKGDAQPILKGKLILDATCAPSDIRYPTDLSLLNEGREKLEGMIDILHEPVRGIIRKPRTYREKARKEYLSVAKCRKNSARKLRKAVGKQLRYVARDLRTIQKLLNASNITLSERHQRELEVIEKMYQQQKTMYDRKEHRIDNRIVSISQPYVRPIVRGKAKAETEFGAKVAISLVDGYAFVEQLSWDNFNESTSLKESVERYNQRFGCYPEVVLADQIYRNRENLSFCKKLGIRLSGPQLGRPSKQEQAIQKRLEYQDSCQRNAVEGKFGEGKRCYGLGRIMTRLQETSETVIVLQFLVMNLERRLRVLFYHFFMRWFPGIYVWMMT